MQSQDMRFANGTTGRLLWWAPGNIDDKKSLPSSHPELLVPSRFGQVLFARAPRQPSSEIGCKRTLDKAMALPLRLH